jgi:hypothetical protein
MFSTSGEDRFVTLDRSGTTPLFLHATSIPPTNEFSQDSPQPLRRVPEKRRHVLILTFEDVNQKGLGDSGVPRVVGRPRTRRVLRE